MKKAIKQINIVRKEIDDTHYYWVNGEFFPGVTRILDEAAPMPYALKQYFLRSTPESAEKKLQITGDFGSLIHATIERLLLGEEINLEEEFPATKAKKHLCSFVAWFDDFKPDVDTIQTEHTIASLTHKYAGTLDLACRKNGEFWIIDFKTGSGIYHNHELQIAAYKQAYEEMYGVKVDHTAIMRTGSRHKKGFEFKEIKRSFKHFKAVYDSYLNLHDGKIPEPPKINVYPEKLQIIKKLKAIKGGEEK